jgi:RNA polymerase sigma-54 factor
MKINLQMQPRMTLSQTLTQILSPKTLQLLKTINLPYQELLEKIDQEKNENPVLEVTKNDELMEYAKALSATMPLSGKKEYNPDDPLMDFRSSEMTLFEHLMSQLRLVNLSPLEYEIGEKLLEAIDDRGFIIGYPELRQELMDKHQVKRTYIDALLEIIQSFEPDGVGARNVKECLIIQINEYNFDSKELQDVIYRAVKYHFEDLTKKKFEPIAQELGIPVEGVQRIADFIEKNLNPNPGSAFTRSHSPEIVIPSFTVFKTESGQYKGINLEEKKGPQLRINEQYLKMLDDPGVDAETKNYVKQKLEAAKDLIYNLERRIETINKILNTIVETQQEFFELGSFWLKPLQQSTLSEMVGIHPSTISRTCSSKYIQTPKGFFPLKYLCPRNVHGYSPYQLKAIIKRMVTEHKDLSDQKLANLLAERGINIKRRTVTKYRHEVGEKSSFERKKNPNPASN